MPTDRVYGWCTSSESVLSEVARLTAAGTGPEDVLKVAERLYARRRRDRLPRQLSLYGTSNGSKVSQNTTRTTRNRGNSLASTADDNNHRPWSSLTLPSSAQPTSSTSTRHSTPNTSPIPSASVPLSPTGQGCLRLEVPHSPLQDGDTPPATASDVTPPAAAAAAAATAADPAPRNGHASCPPKLEPSHAEAIKEQTGSSSSGHGHHASSSDGHPQQHQVTASMSTVSFNSEASSSSPRVPRRQPSLATTTASTSTSSSTYRHAKRYLEQPVTQADIERAAECGQFKERPSDLFLKIYACALRTLHKDPTVGVVSPSLMASTGVIPLSIISVIPDIVQHYADVIRSAEHEVFLATNFWENSNSSRLITDALQALNQKAQKLGRKIVVKIMYDRGNVKQVVDAHQIVPPEVYTGQAVKLPDPAAVPHLSMEVCNFHVFMLGTFHCKYLVVDRRVALISSNNIQDRCNLEMMSHLEGDIVQSFYDQALLTWQFAMKPPLPLLSQDIPSRNDFAFGESHPDICVKENLQFAESAIRAEKGSQENRFSEAEEQMGSHTDGPGPFRSLLHAEGGSTNLLTAISRRLNTTLQSTKASLAGPSFRLDDFQPHLVHKPHAPVPIALVNRRPRGSLNYTDVTNPQSAAFLGALCFAEESILIQTPTFNAPAAVAGCLAAVKRGVKVVLYLNLGFNDASERLPKQGGTNEQVVKHMYSALKSDEEKERLHIYWYVAKDMAEPIHASRKQRNCHIKYMNVDGKVSILGNSNHDSQSWHHSQETNIMVDSEALSAEWVERLDANQNTDQFGRLETDGYWHNPQDGSILESKNDAGFMATLKGFKDTWRRAAGR